MTDTNAAAGRHAIDITLFELLAASRRTSLRVDPDRAVPVELVERLCRLAMWAPNHRKTWPWRFASFSGGGRALLGATIAGALESKGVTDDRRLEKFRTKYLRAPVVLVVGSAKPEDDFTATENRDAVAAGVQNLLLGATAAGLASFWSSAVPEVDDRVVELCGFGPDAQTVAVIYLGWPIADVAVPDRPEPHVVVVDSD